MGLKSMWKAVIPVKPESSSHVPGVREGNSTGNYENQPGHTKDGRSTAERSTGVSPESKNPIHPDSPNLSPP